MSAQSSSSPNAALVGLWLVKSSPVACFARNKPWRYKHKARGRFGTPGYLEFNSSVLLPKHEEWIKVRKTGPSSADSRDSPPFNVSFLSQLCLITPSLLIQSKRSFGLCRVKNFYFSNPYARASSAKSTGTEQLG